MKYIDRYFRTIIENIKDALIGIDKNGNINMINSTAEELLGLRFEDVIRERISEVIPNSRLLRVIETKKKK
jgi:PAS domain S-box-containing protein